MGGLPPTLTSLSIQKLPFLHSIRYKVGGDRLIPGRDNSHECCTSDGSRKFAISICTFSSVLFAQSTKLKGKKFQRKNSHLNTLELDEYAQTWKLGWNMHTWTWPPAMDLRGEFRQHPRRL